MLEVIIWVEHFGASLDSSSHGSIRKSVQPKGSCCPKYLQMVSVGRDTGCERSRNTELLLLSVIKASVDRGFESLLQINLRVEAGCLGSYSRLSRSDVRWFDSCPWFGLCGSRRSIPFRGCGTARRDPPLLCGLECLEQRCVHGVTSALARHSCVARKLYSGKSAISQADNPGAVHFLRSGSCLLRSPPLVLLTRDHMKLRVAF